MENTMIEKIGNRIRKYREDANISQKKLGMSLGLSDKAISAYESCRTLPPIETLEKIAIELNKPLEAFITDDTMQLELSDRIDKISQILEEVSKEMSEIKSLCKKS